MELARLSLKDFVHKNEILEYELFHASSDIVESL